MNAATPKEAIDLLFALKRRGISAEIEDAQKAVDQLYARWAELEEKQSSGSF